MGLLGKQWLKLKRKVEGYTSFKFMISNLRMWALLGVWTFLIIIHLTSCNRKTDGVKERIKGDWYITLGDSTRQTYQEMFFSDSLAYRCDRKIGIKHAYRYFIQNDSLRLVDWQDGVRFSLGKLTINGDEILCQGEAGYFIFKSIERDSFLLSQLIEEEIVEEEFYSGFNRRFNEYYK